MSDEQVRVIVEPTPKERRAAAVAHARQAWEALGEAIRSITPSRLVRCLLVIGAIWLIIWVIISAGAALIPFQIGIVLAYLLLPLINRLSTRMPRWAAILLTLGSGLLVIIIAFTFIIPPVAQQVRNLISSLPGTDDFRGLFASLQSSYNRLPLETRQIIDESVGSASTFLRTNIDGYLRSTLSFLLNTVLTLANTATFLFGFLVVPFWLFYVMNDYHAGVKAVDRLLPHWLRADFWAVLRITDQTFSKYIRGQLLLGVIIGITSYIGLTALKLAGVGGIQYELLLALVAGVTELVPLIGPIIGAIPAVILAFTDSWQSGLAVLALYIGIQQLENSFLVPRVQGESIEIHPAVLSASLVALSQFGFIWLVLAAPLVAIVRDLFRYVYGRVSDPPAPAGTIPGDKVDGVGVSVDEVAVVEGKAV